MTKIEILLEKLLEKKTDVKNFNRKSNLVQHKISYMSQLNWADFCN